MFENISKKQEKIQEKVQKQQKLNDKDCRELSDEELDQIVGGTFVPGEKDDVTWEGPQNTHYVTEWSA